jgi:hypothetical protein
MGARVGGQFDAVKMTGNTPPRKGRSTVASGGGGGGVEEAWLVAEAPVKKSHARAAECGVTVRFGHRGHFNWFVLLLLVLFIVLAVSITSNNDGSDGHEQREAATTVPPPPADDPADGEQVELVGECDMSSGRWVYDDVAYPLYEESACKFMSDQSACGKFGRTDLKYQHWKWQPHGCDLPRYCAFIIYQCRRNYVTKSILVNFTRTNNGNSIFCKKNDLESTDCSTAHVVEAVQCSSWLVLCLAADGCLCAGSTRRGCSGGCATSGWRSSETR